MKRCLTKSIILSLGILFFTILLPKTIYASENPILFYGITCPFCDVVKEEIDERGIDEEIEIDELEIYNNNDNAKIFQEKIAVCNIPQNRAGVPLLFMDDSCYVGVDPIVLALESKIGRVQDVENNIVQEDIETEIEEEVDSQEEENGQRNTVLMIILIPVLLLLLVIGGYALKKEKPTTNLILLLLLLPLFFQNLSSASYAICPVCTVAVGAGLGVSRYLGIDDLIMAIWIGGLVLSVAISFGIFLSKKTKLSKTLSEIISVVIFFTLLLATLHLIDITGNPFNQIWGIDKIVLGSTIGGIVFKIGALVHFKLIDKHSGKSFIPFQKVVIPVGFLWLASLLFYIILY